MTTEPTTYSGTTPLLTVLRDSRYIGQEAMRHSAADEIERFLAAAKAVEDWWLSEGMKHFDGAPYAIFAVRAALHGGSNANPA